MRPFLTLLAYAATLLGLGLIPGLTASAALIAWARRRAAQILAEACAEADAIRDRAGGHVEAALDVEAASASRAVEILLAATAAERGGLTRASGPDR